MRSLAELELMVTAAIATSNGAVPASPCRVDLIARDQEEADWFAARLKGRRNVKAVGVRLEGAPAAEEELDYDGY